jgi:hypothetical protein
MICTKGKGSADNCGAIKSVDRAECCNSGCDVKLPDHPENSAEERILIPKDMELLSHREWEDNWICPGYSVTNKREWELCDFTQCNRPRDQHALWIVGGQPKQA